MRRGGLYILVISIPHSPFPIPQLPPFRRLANTTLDIQATNILLTLPTTHPLDEFAEVENSHPSAHKTVDDRRTIYRSRRLSLSSPSELNSQDSLDSVDKPPGVPTLTDFGLAVQNAHAPHAGVIQPLMFRAPEVILRMPWDGRADIWNLGVLVSYSCLCYQAAVREYMGEKVTNDWDRCGSLSSTNTFLMGRRRGSSLSI
jgi:serine/threonine protein kinase